MVRFRAGRVHVRIMVRVSISARVRVMFRFMG